MRFGEIGLQLEHFPVASDGLVKAASVLKNITQIESRFKQIRLECERPLIGGNCLPRFALFVERVPEIRVCGIEIRKEFNGPAVTRDSFVQSPDALQSISKTELGLRKIGLEGQRLPGITPT